MFLTHNVGVVAVQAVLILGRGRAGRTVRPDASLRCTGGELLTGAVLVSTDLENKKILYKLRIQKKLHKNLCFY